MRIAPKPSRLVTCVALMSLIPLAGAGCVSRNVERISADEAAGMPPPPAPIPADERAASVAEVPGIDGTISLAPELAGQQPSGSLFVIVRVAGRASGPPLAVKQIATDLPSEFRISEEDSMIPGTPFVGDLDLIVRLDRDGNAFTHEDGDLEGRVGPVKAGDRVEVLLRPSPAEGSE